MCSKPWEQTARRLAEADAPDQRQSDCPPRWLGVFLCCSPCRSGPGHSRQFFYPRRVEPGIGFHLRILQGSHEGTLADGDTVPGHEQRLVFQTASESSLYSTGLRRECNAWSDS